LDAAGANGDCDLAWLAGLLEGEGSFQTNHTVRLSLQMTDKDVVARAADLCRATVRGPRRPANADWSPTWYFDLYGQRALAVADRVKALMGIRRNGQIDRMTSSYRPSVPPDRVSRNVQITRRYLIGESGPALAAEFDMTHQNLYYIVRRYRDRVRAVP
jgi:hypothetical protein